MLDSSTEVEALRKCSFRLVDNIFSSRLTKKWCRFLLMYSSTLNIYEKTSTFSVNIGKEGLRPYVEYA